MQYTNSLLSNTIRVSAPFVRCTIGGFTFGVYNKENNKTTFPNFIQSLNVKKINGAVNTYDLSIKYPVSYNADPNFFERILSTAAHDRKIVFTYGDFASPNDTFKDEEAIMTKINTTVDIKNGVIGYNISAVGNSTLSLSGNFSFPAYKNTKPSEVILEVLTRQEYHLQEVFFGMRDLNKVLENNLIARDDQAIDIPAVTNVSALTYIARLVSMMIPVGSTGVKQKAVYSLATFEDDQEKFGGPYFKVQKIESSWVTANKLCTYTIDIGYPTANLVSDFRIETTENWSIYYDYRTKSHNFDYVKRIDNDGELEYIYSPLLTNAKYKLDEADKSWWTKVTEFPINVSITIQGLLKPAILMSYIKLNVWFSGNKHISSGYYIITSQQDSISGSGFKTTLGLTRVAADEEMIYR